MTGVSEIHESEIETTPVVKTRNPVPAAVIDEKPSVLLLAIPALFHEPESFGVPPEPVPAHSDASTQTEFPPVAVTLIDPKQSDASDALYRANLPEPALPEAPPVMPAEVKTVLRPAAPAEAETVMRPAAAAESAVARVEGHTGLDAAKPGVTASAAGPVARPASEEPPDGVILNNTAGETGQPMDGRRLTFAPSDTIALAFAGRGWIFTGAGGDEGEIFLRSRTIAADETLFEFDAKSPGEYVLEFQIQDSRSGTQTRESVTIILEEDQQGGVTADRYAATSAPAEKQVTVARPSNLSQALEDPAGARELLSQILFHVTPEQQEELDGIARWYKSAGYLSEYALCLERFVKIFPRRPDNDFRYYELGRLHETEELRNEKKARNYYAAVVDLYPASLYYFDAAKRVRYLDRHFLDLR